MAGAGITFVAGIDPRLIPAACNARILAAKQRRAHAMHSRILRRRKRVEPRASEPMFDMLVARGIEPYQRERHLPRVLPIGPDELGDLSESGRRSILRRLARALRAERNRGRAGHWTYDLNR